MVLPRNDGHRELPLADIILSLVYQEDLGSTMTGLEVKEQRVSSSIKPPCGIPLVFVKHIYIIFTFSHLQTTSVLTKRKVPLFEDTCSDMLFAAVESQHEHLPILPDSPAYPLDRDGYQSILSKRTFTQSVDQETCIPRSPWVQEYSPVPPKVHSFSCSHEEDISPDINRHSKEIKPVSMIDNSVLTDCIKLADAGLRSIISKPQVPTSKSIKVKVNFNVPKLAEIAPALFRPGYLQVSQTLSGSIRQ